MYVCGGTGTYSSSKILSFWFVHSSWSFSQWLLHALLFLNPSLTNLNFWKCLLPIREVQNHHAWMTSASLFSMLKCLCIFTAPWLWLCFIAFRTTSWLLNWKLASSRNFPMGTEKHYSVYIIFQNLPGNWHKFTYSKFITCHSDNPQTLEGLVNNSHSPSWVNSGCTFPRDICMYKFEDPGDAPSYFSPWGSSWIVGFFADNLLLLHFPPPPFSLQHRVLWQGSWGRVLCFICWVNQSCELGFKIPKI